MPTSQLLAQRPLSKQVSSHSTFPLVLRKTPKPIRQAISILQAALAEAKANWKAARAKAAEAAAAAAALKAPAAAAAAAAGEAAAASSPPGPAAA